jgi:hypothetical protein
MRAQTNACAVIRLERKGYSPQRGCSVIAPLPIAGYSVPFGPNISLSVQVAYPVGLPHFASFGTC